jgi:hypothetical protein
MADQHRGFPFRWVLPCAQFAVCLAILWPARGFLILGVLESVDSYSRPRPESSAVQGPRRFDFVVPAVPPESQLKDDASIKIADKRMKAPLALDFPVLVAELPYILASPAKREWVPKGMPPDIWRALSWPFVGLLFWWSLGKSVEALTAARRSVANPRITWIETAFAIILSGTGLVAIVGVLTSTPDDRNDLQFMTLLAGAVLWGILASVTLAARLLQRRISKRNASAPATPGPSTA